MRDRQFNWDRSDMFMAMMAVCALLIISHYVRDGCISGQQEKTKRYEMYLRTTQPPHDPAYGLPENEPGGR